ncbi:MAG: acyl-CoA thioesterase [Bacteroidales bacterium]|nr:acyl-CoA thioesterase [Bacteroidales bacterium]
MAKTLTTEKELDIRFSEVDSMNVVWHGSYMLYFEDAREAFGERFGLDYMTIFNNGCFAPLVDMEFHWRRPIRYGMHPVIEIRYRPTEAAKILFDYTIRDSSDGTVFATGRSVQVFMDHDYNLLWENPPFYIEWKKRWEVCE